MKRIENRTFAELNVGDCASIARTLTRRDIQLFAAMSGDVNPAHVDDAFAASGMFHKVVAHGMWGGALISAVLGTQLPGPGAIYLGQSLRFRRPVGIGDTITVTVKVTEKIEEKKRVVLDCAAINQNGEVVITGVAEVIAPVEKISRECVPLPEVKLVDRGRHYREFIAKAKEFGPIRTAVVYPVDAASLAGVVEAAEAKLIVPVLVGPKARMIAAAAEAHVDVSGYEIVPAEHGHGAAAVAVAMARDHKVLALMNGSLQTGELINAITDGQRGLSNGRSMSCVLAVDAPGYPRPLFITDTGINVAPAIETKRDIIQNAIELAHAAGISSPNIAVLSSDGTLAARHRSNRQAALLRQMADRGQISGGILDGPLDFDSAVSEEAAQAEGIVSAVAGHADICLVPDIEAGNMFARQLQCLAEAEVAGLVVGARVPVILSSRADKALARLASCALALLLVYYTRTVMAAA